MRKIFLSLLLSVVMIMVCIPTPANAEKEITESTTTTAIYFNDGSYGIITIIQDNVVNRASVSGTKQFDYYDSSNDKVWTYSITGVFSYNGSTSSCTAVSDSYSIINSNWHLDSHSCSKSGNTANGSITMKKKIIGITIDTVTRSLSLSCSANGTLS